MTLNCDIGHVTVNKYVKFHYNSNYHCNVETTLIELHNTTEPNPPFYHFQNDFDQNLHYT